MPDSPGAASSFQKGLVLRAAGQSPRRTSRPSGDDRSRQSRRNVPTHASPGQGISSRVGTGRRECQGGKPLTLDQHITVKPCQGNVAVELSVSSPTRSRFPVSSAKIRSLPQARKERPPVPPTRRTPSDVTGVVRRPCFSAMLRARQQALQDATAYENIGLMGRHHGKLHEDLHAQFVLSRRLSQSESSLDRPFDEEDDDNEDYCPSSMEDLSVLRRTSNKVDNGNVGCDIHLEIENRPMVRFQDVPTEIPHDILLRPRSSPDLHRMIESGFVDDVSDPENQCQPPPMHRMSPLSTTKHKINPVTPIRPSFKDIEKPKPPLPPDYKPVIENVVLIKDQKKDVPPAKQDTQSTLSRSAEQLDRLDILRELNDVPCDYFLKKNLRSSFLEGELLKRQTVSFNSDVQTLLKHTREGEDPIYSLPKALSYGEDTLRAVKEITDKYDTFRRQQMQAKSFRESDLLRLRANFNKPSAPAKKKETRPRSEPTSPSCTLEYPREAITNIPPPEMFPEPPETASSGGLVRGDVARLEMFYRSRECQVAVCQCMADMFIGTLSVKEIGGVKDWKHEHTGVPVFVLNTGQAQRRRELFLVLAERDTGFPLWQDKINYLTNYAALGSATHIFNLSSSLSKVAKLHMFSEDAAQTFMETYRGLTADPDDELWKVSSQKSSKKGKKATTKRRKSIKKEDISQPCNFIHVTRIDPSQAASVTLFDGSDVQHQKTM